VPSRFCKICPRTRHRIQVTHRKTQIKASFPYLIDHEIAGRHKGGSWSCEPKISGHAADVAEASIRERPLHFGQRTMSINLAQTRDLFASPMLAFRRQSQLLSLGPHRRIGPLATKRSDRCLIVGVQSSKRVQLRITPERRAIRRASMAPHSRACSIARCHSCCKKGYSVHGFLLDCPRTHSENRNEEPGKPGFQTLRATLEVSPRMLQPGLQMISPCPSIKPRRPPCLPHDRRPAGREMVIASTSQITFPIDPATLLPGHFRSLPYRAQPAAQ
jgi:hypothetical protein